ncbi:hypothetical protein SCL_1494 [Sulfuricaulis limicola]|uniref:Uncharacterized protein n=1 Tax=Sulfuricaulis limicola TaxID=1620215 RepID=A0A1B4XG58_9GAMM|nr:hypothetical protein SCL_1494 [Sulfuricaulis limicola]
MSHPREWAVYKFRHSGESRNPGLEWFAQLLRDSKWFCVAFGDAYLWVADPRQVTFFARAKKVTKESTPPDGANTPLRFSPAPARASTRRAQNTRLGLEHEAREYPDAGCDARARHTGFLKHTSPITVESLMGRVFQRRSARTNYETGFRLSPE